MAFELVFNYQKFLNHNLQILNNYTHQLHVLIYRQLGNLSQVCDNYFSVTTIAKWILVFLLIWSLIYIFYARATCVIFKRMALPTLHRNRLTESLWNFGFYIGSISLCILKLLMFESQTTYTFNITKNNFIAEEIMSAHVLFSCSVVFSLLIHGIILTFLHKGIEAEFFSKGLFMTFLYAAYSLRYLWLILTVMLLISICSLFVELMRIFYTFNKGKTVKSGCLRASTCLLFAIHCILWGGIFLYLLPKYYLMPAINIKVPDEEVRTLAVLSAALWSYFCLEIFCAPAMKLVRYYVWPDYSYGRRDWLDFILFPPRNDVIEHLKRIRSKARLEQANSFQYSYFKERSLSENDLLKNRNSVVLFQTVKCVMAMKRRIRRKRAAKALLTFASDDSSDTGNTSQPTSSSENVCDKGIGQKADNHVGNSDSENASDIDSKQKINQIENEEAI